MENKYKRFQEQAIRILDKVKMDEEGSLSKALGRLKELGWEEKQQFTPYSSMYSKVWEHEWATGINSRHTSDYARDMCHHFFTLYALTDPEDANLFEPFELWFGRVGNTTSWALRPPEDYQEDRQDVIDQQLLFER